MTTRNAIDPDRLAALEDERDFLLRSLDDLDAEHAAGDLDDIDYASLRDDYTVRAAGVIRHIEDHQSELEALRGKRSSPTRRWAWIVGTAASAVLAGMLLAQAAGERGVGETLTGSLDVSLRERILDCQELGTQGAEGIQESLECFDAVLDQDPNNVEALSYRAWYVSIVAASADDQGITESAGELFIGAAEQLDRAIEIDPTYPDARVFRAVVADRLGDTSRACTELEALAELNAPPMMGQLTSSLDERLACP